GPEAVSVVDSFVDALPAQVEPASRAIARTAAELRGRPTGALRLPDALVVATALAVGADRLITTDAGWPALPVSVEVLAPAD
ncbi:MAG TPA: PIN domain-containing protein, partial [Patescibacteria group bacterium]|nr:PIN domain-containing protein [Patescibacteria group bacterium]